MLFWRYFNIHLRFEVGWINFFFFPSLMPRSFKKNSPEPLRGWSGARRKTFVGGSSCYFSNLTLWVTLNGTCWISCTFFSPYHTLFFPRGSFRQVAQRVLFSTLEACCIKLKTVWSHLNHVKINHSKVVWRNFGREYLDVSLCWICRIMQDWYKP